MLSCLCLPRTLLFSRGAVSACRGCASSCKHSSPSSAPVTPHPWTRCSEPSAAPRGTKGKGCLCSLWHLSLDIFDFQLFEAQTVRLIPNWPLSLENDAPGRAQCFSAYSCDWLLILAIVQNGNRTPFLLSVFLVPLLLSVGSSCDIRDFVKSFPCSCPYLVKQWSGSTVLGPLCSVR